MSPGAGVVRELGDGPTGPAVDSDFEEGEVI